MKKRRRVLSPDEAQRAIYIDFEGRKDHPPALLGALYAEGKAARDDRIVLRQEIVEPELFAVPMALEFDGISRYDHAARPIGTAVRDLFLRAAKQKRMVVSFSRHDRNVINRYAENAETRALIEEWYCDGKDTAIEWGGRCRPDLVLTRQYGKKHTLSAYLAEIGFELPHSYGKGLVGSWITAVQEAMTKRSGGELTAVQKGKWTKLLQHNALDLVGLRRLMVEASADLVMDNLTR